jgi:hypothetical protein
MEVPKSDVVCPRQSIRPDRERLGDMSRAFASRGLCAIDEQMGK